MNAYIDRLEPLHVDNTMSIVTSLTDLNEFASVRSKLLTEHRSSRHSMRGLPCHKTLMICHHRTFVTRFSVSG
jgi:hypothetical protein